MMDRRSFLVSAGVALMAGPVGAASNNPVIPLWPHEPPGGGGPSGPVRVSEKGAVSNIAMPVLEVFAPTRPGRAAMLVAAGGGYKRIEMANEAYPAARWLAAQGITTFVLSYRLPPEGWNEGPLAPLQDAQRALRLIRANAARYGIDPHRVGVLGFSAGGHLMGLVSTRSAFASYQPGDAIDTESARPDMAALIYPVITLKPPYDHTSTRKSLVGPHPDQQASAEWSVETHVRSGCPPMFLVQAEDDPISDPVNTLIMAEACQRAGVPVELHRLPSGGHGFGMGKPGTPTSVLPGFYATWLHKEIPS
jgi:acetyl esterase/lipase